MTTLMTKTTHTGRKRVGRTQPTDPRLLLQGKPLTFWMDGSKNPLIEKIMKAWGDDLRNLSELDADYIVWWLAEQRIKRKPDEQPSARAQAFYSLCGELSPDEMKGIIKAIMHKKEG